MRPEYVLPQETTMLYTGGCFCGSVRYQSAGPPEHASLCHCTSCRRVSGSPAMGWVTFARTDFQLVAADPAEFRSSPSVVRTFCSTCGTPVTYWHEDWPDIIDVALGTLDAPNETAPGEHIWMSDALPWDKPNDGLKQYAESRL